MPALATPPSAALHQKETIARLLTGIASESVVQNAICMVTAVKMFTALHVIIIIKINNIASNLNLIIIIIIIEPRTCADVGITQCCNDPSGTGQPPAMTEMTAVQMHRSFACVSKHQPNKRESLYGFVDKLWGTFKLI